MAERVVGTGSFGVVYQVLFGDRGCMNVLWVHEYRVFLTLLFFDL